MNHFKKLFVTILCTFSGYAVADTNSIKIEYASPINGYLVQAVWQPDQEKNHSWYLVGPATITFHNIKSNTKFQLKTDNFSILRSKLPFKYKNDESLEPLDLNRYKHIILDYQIDIPKGIDHNSQFNIEHIDDVDILKSKLPFRYGIDNNVAVLDLSVPGYKHIVQDNQIAGIPTKIGGNSFGIGTEPFFFEDINFDGIKELFLLEAHKGQRGFSAFKAYKLKADGSLAEVDQITEREPFSSLDGSTHIDYTNKEIGINNSMGWCSSSYHTYQLDKTTNRYNLSRIYTQETDDKYCYQYTYQIKKELISKTRERLSEDKLNLKDNIWDKLSGYWFSFVQNRPMKHEPELIASI